VASAVAGCPASSAGKPSGEDGPAIALGLMEHSVNTRRNKRRGCYSASSNQNLLAMRKAY
jgi:hypothetical protein